jgi:hypothetical protein
MNDWYNHTLSSRLIDKRQGCIILTMQRLHEDDLVGHVLGRVGGSACRHSASAVEPAGLGMYRTWPYASGRVHVPAVDSGANDSRVF